MRRTLHRRMRRGAAAVASLVLIGVAGGPGTSGAAAVRAAAGTGAGGSAPARNLTQALAPIDVNGGYVAAGTGMRNRGYGSIHVAGIPVASTVARAYLYWSVDGLGHAPGATFKDGKVDGVAIAGTLVGSTTTGACGGTNASFGYRADVTALVHGNGDYQLSNFRTGTKDGSDPFVAGSTAPNLNGASLVVVYRNDTFPPTRVVLADGDVVVGAQPVASAVSWGFPATNPVGQVRTTSIGGDGQAGPDAATRFNGTALPTVDWDGTDPQTGGGYSQGDLWDTDTVDVGRLVRPGDTGAFVSVGGGGDCVTWVAQVTSIGRDGAADTDGDGLLDGWEANGNDADGNGTVDVNLPAMGASVVHKDVFVEMDSMGAETTCPCHLPLAPDLDRIVAAFATSPYADNPDGRAGIAMHLDAGKARGAKYDLGGGNVVPHDNDLNPVATEFAPIKTGNFSPLRAKTFHYMVWAHGYDGGSSSGLSFGIGADSFIVTLGLWSGHGSSDAKVGTFIHELGHNLGLGHGGNDLITNYKPNYLSVMNYFFQVTGVPQASGGPPLFSYSRYKLPTLVETNLDERAGIPSARADEFLTRWYCEGGILQDTVAAASGPIDWNCDGVISAAVRTDITDDGAVTPLGGWRDWGNLYFSGGTIGADGPGVGLQASMLTPAPREFTYEESLRLVR